MSRQERAGRCEIIALAGFMGAGKTTVGREVARRLGWPFIDLDRSLVAGWGARPAEWFGWWTEKSFRRVEASMLQVLCRSAGPMVLATGGGSPVDPRSCTFLKRRCFSVWLTAPVEEIRRRLGRDGERPLLDDDPAALLDSRREAYQGCSRLVVDTEGRCPGEVAVEVIQAWHSG